MGRRIIDFVLSHVSFDVGCVVSFAVTAAWIYGLAVLVKLLVLPLLP